MSVIEELANRQRLELERNNNRVMLAMASDLQPSLEYLNTQIGEIQAEIDELKAQGKEPGPSLLYKDNRAQKMRKQLEDLLREYHGKNAIIIDGMRDRAIKAGAEDQYSLIESGTGSYSKVPRKALEALSAQLASDTPVRASLELYAQDSITEALDSMKKGLTLGWGSQRLAREMNSVVGGNLAKAMTIARTEVNRAYREASHITRLENASLLDGWYWLSSLRKDSCPACLLQHGTLHPLEERLNDHPNGSCTTIPAISGVANPISPTGAEIFNQMSESEKKEKLGPALYEAYSSNPKLTPLDLITTRQSDVWGQTHSTISAKALKRLVDDNPEEGIPSSEVAYGPVEGETPAEAKRRRARERREARKVGTDANKKPPVPERVEPNPTTQQKETPEEAKRRRARERRQARKAIITPPPVVEPVVSTKETPEEAKKRRAKERREARKARATEVLGTENIIKNPVKKNPKQEKKEVPNIREVGEYIQSAPRGDTPGLRMMKLIVQDFREEIEEIADVHEVLRLTQKTYVESVNNDPSVWNVNMDYNNLKRAYDDLGLGLAFSSRRIINTFIRKQDPERIKLEDYNIDNAPGPWVEHVKDLLSMFKPGILTGQHKTNSWDRKKVRPLNISMDLARSYYQTEDNKAVVPLDHQPNHSSVVWHELGHWAEQRGNPRIYSECMKFYERRTKKDSYRQLNKLFVNGYGEHERTRPDDFLHPYMGKKYQDRATEIFSMGLEKIKENPLAFMLADPDYFELMVNLLEGHFDN